MGYGEGAWGGAEDTSPPTIENITPPDGATLAQYTRVTFDVRDDVGFREIIVMVKFGATGEWEVVFDGQAIAPRYAASSSFVASEFDYHFSIVRQGGWPSAPKFDVRAIDTSGGAAGS